MDKVSTLLIVIILGITTVDRSRDVRAIDEAAEDFFKCELTNIFFVTLVEDHRSLRL